MRTSTPCCAISANVLSSQGDLVDSYDPALKGANHPAPQGRGSRSCPRARIERGMLIRSSVRCAGSRPARSSPAASPCARSRARVPPAAPPATDDHRHVDQVLVVLVAEEALAQLGQPVLSSLQI